jgi:hypothetical protein
LDLLSWLRKQRSHALGGGRSRGLGDTRGLGESSLGSHLRGCNRGLGESSLGRHLGSGNDSDRGSDYLKVV